MWNGIYIDGERDISIFQQTPNIIIKDNIDFLIVDTLNAVKIIIEGLHPEDRVYVTNNGRIRACDEGNAFDVFLIPEKVGKLHFKVYALRLKDNFFVGEIDLDVK